VWSADRYGLAGAIGQLDQQDSAGDTPMKLEIPVCTKLDAATVERLDRIAAERGAASRASTVRDAITRGLAVIESTAPRK
jgi:hypothetical protein